MNKIIATPLHENMPPDIEPGYYKKFSIDKIKTAYIIDDDEIIVHLTNELLRKEQFCEHCETFENGQVALNHIKQAITNNEELPDVMLIDIHMPVMDGWEFLDELTKIPIKKTIPIFLFTSFITSADREKSFSYPSIKGHIQKPLTVIKLNKILRLIS